MVNGNELQVEYKMRISAQVAVLLKTCMGGPSAHSMASFIAAQADAEAEDMDGSAVQSVSWETLENIMLGLECAPEAELKTSLGETPPGVFTTIRCKPDRTSAAVVISGLPTFLRLMMAQPGDVVYCGFNKQRRLCLALYPTGRAHKTEQEFIRYTFTSFFLSSSTQDQPPEPPTLMELLGAAYEAVQDSIKLGEVLAKERWQAALSSEAEAEAEAEAEDH